MSALGNFQAGATKPTPTFGFGSTSAFGASNTNTAQPPAAPTFGAFGAAAGQAQTPAAGGNVFGQPPAQAAATGGGLFGQPASTGAAAGATGGGGLFGGTAGTTAFSFGGTGTNNGNANAQAGPSSGLFGSLNGSTNNNNAPGAAPTNAFSFGGTAGQSNTPSIFGQPQAQQQQQQQPTNMFQSTTTQFGGQSQFQQQPQQQQQHQQQQQQNQSALHPFLCNLTEIPGTIMYDDIASRKDKNGNEQGAKMGDQMKAFAEAMKALAARFAEHNQERLHMQPGNLADDLANDRRRIIRLEGNATIYFQSLVSLTKRVHSLTRQSDEAIAEFTRVHGVMMAAGQSAGKGVPGEAPRRIYTEFFTKLSIDMNEKMKLFQKTLDQIERQLASLQKDQNLPTAQAIAQAVANNQKSVMSLAAEIGELEGRVKELVVHYRREFRRKNNTALDPIEMFRAQQGVSRLSMKQGQSGAFYEEMDDLVVL